MTYVPNLPTNREKIVALTFLLLALLGVTLTGTLLQKVIDAYFLDIGNRAYLDHLQSFDIFYTPLAVVFLFILGYRTNRTISFMIFMAVIYICVYMGLGCGAQNNLISDLRALETLSMINVSTTKVFYTLFILSVLMSLNNKFGTHYIAFTFVIMSIYELSIYNLSAYLDEIVHQTSIYSMIYSTVSAMAVFLFLSIITRKTLHDRFDKCELPFSLQKYANSSFVILLIFASTIPLINGVLELPFTVLIKKLYEANAQAYSIFNDMYSWKIAVATALGTLAGLSLLLLIPSTTRRFILHLMVPITLIIFVIFYVSCMLDTNASSIQHIDAIVSFQTNLRSLTALIYPVLGFIMAYNVTKQQRYYFVMFTFFGVPMFTKLIIIGLMSYDAQEFSKHTATVVPIITATALLAVSQFVQFTNMKTRS